jgi:hypothetical protein
MAWGKRCGDSHFQLGEEAGLAAEGAAGGALEFLHEGCPEWRGGAWGSVRWIRERVLVGNLACRWWVWTTKRLAGVAAAVTQELRKAAESADLVVEIVNNRFWESYRSGS